MLRISSCIGSMMLLLALASQVAAPGQLHAQRKPATEWDGQGSAPVDPGPLATDVSADLTTTAVDHILRKVADWQLEQSQEYFSQDWTYGALYPGLMAVGRVLNDPRYEDALLGVGKKFDWQLGPRLIDPNYEGHGQARGQTYDANNQALAQTYLELYEDHRDPVMMASVQRQFDSILTEAEPPHAPRWWWCDALFMAPPAWVRLYRITGNKAYLDYMNQHWWATSDLLYDPVEHLYFRDSNFFERREKNGRKLFWSRGNGWVIAGLARVIEELPPAYPYKPRYIAQFKQMAERLASLQGADGLWRPGLLDPGGYEAPEMSGSGFFVYAMAWGVRHGILDRRVYMPVIRKGWQGMVSHVYADGRVGSIQPIAAGPGNYKPSSSYVYGVGAFLLAGSEIHELASRTKR
jgi:unsaturated rhamnogalacturonyl hydrolase